MATAEPPQSKRCRSRVETRGCYGKRLGHADRRSQDELNYLVMKSAVWPHLPDITNSRMGLRTRGAVSRSR